MCRAGHAIVGTVPTQLRAARELGRRWAIEAKTIHRLLEVDPKSGGFKRGDDNPLDCNLLVVDETRPHRRGSYVPTPDKKHRVAVTRALRQMELPPQSQRRRTLTFASTPAALYPAAHDIDHRRSRRYDSTLGHFHAA